MTIGDDDDNPRIGQGGALAKVAKGVTSITPGGIAKTVVIELVAKAIEDHGWEAVKWAVEKLRPKKPEPSSAGVGLAVALLALGVGARPAGRRRRR